MNRIALRLAVGLLSTAIIVVAAMPFVARWHFSYATGSHALLHDQLLVASKLPVTERDRALRELARAYSVPVEIVPASDLPDSDGVRFVPMARPPGFGAAPALARARRSDRPHGPMPLEMLIVRIPGGDDAIRAGPIRPPLWPLGVILLGVSALVAVAATLLARPMVRRLQRLQETAMRIARGELGARADNRGADAISDFAVHFNQMADRNQAMLEGQRDLLRGVSHELRTPVARIRFSLELARDAQAESDRERHLTAIDEDLGEIDELIQELLLVDRLQEGSVTMPVHAFDVLATVQDEVERQRASYPQIEVLLENIPEGSMQVIGSERLFRRVVRNLTSNALRHAKLRVNISVARAAETITLRVEDDGPGIPVVERARILEPFVRLDESRSRELGGVGLGLTIVDRILRAVGGRLRIGKANSGGASVAMEWPCEAKDGR
jgi:two-component system sensor histidine kinase RstB